MSSYIKTIPCISLILVLACSKDNHSHSPCTSTSTTVSYGSFIAPLIANSCTNGCHKAGAPEAANIPLTSYTEVKKHVDHGHFYTVMANGSMPKGASKLPDSILTKVKSWADACGPDN